MSGWFLTKVAIEGFRGINNQGDPLELKFKADKVNSVFATNGIGKSSIFDAITYALTGAIPKLKGLPSAEAGESYYLNRFHPADYGTVALTLTPEAGGGDMVVTITRHENGNRTVATSDGSNGEAILRELNREFVLLDARTFQKFIEDKPLERGRDFAGLLGLNSYSTLRKSLEAAANTRAFNNFFDATGTTAKNTHAEGDLAKATASVKEAYKVLIGDDLDPAMPEEDLTAKAHSALAHIALIKPECEGRKFADISPDDCLKLVKEAEGGTDRERLAQVIRAEAAFDAAVTQVPAADHIEALKSLAVAYDEALEKTRGDDFLKLFQLTTRILESEQWAEKGQCPACDKQSDHSLLDHVKAKAAQYDAVSQASAALKAEWTALGWSNLNKLDELTRSNGEPGFVQPAAALIMAGSFTAAAAGTFIAKVSEAAERGKARLGELRKEKDALEAKLPRSLVELTEKVEAARRLQKGLKDATFARNEAATLKAKIARVSRVKTFLDAVNSGFADAESDAATRRLAAVEPICQDLFKNIMFADVVPSIHKRAGSADLSISLSNFHTLSNVSAQAVLSESYRNAFAISVYLAAASLYGGAPRFLIFDDVTSSFDGGHQYHLMQVISSSFARPGMAGGPQVIVLSHDTLLEKYFNTQVNNGIWWHQRIEGSPRTAVLPQSNAVNRVRDSILSFLNAGNAIDGGSRIREYLEFRLEEVINRCRIPVPIDVAISDDKRLCSAYLDAIKEAVKLHKAAGSLILTAPQEAGLNTAMMTIVSNYLAHWNTGQTASFTANALLGVMQAVDNFTECFKFEPVPGAQRKYYRNLASQN